MGLVDAEKIIEDGRKFIENAEELHKKKELFEKYITMIKQFLREVEFHIGCIEYNPPRDDVWRKHNCAFGVTITHPKESYIKGERRGHLTLVLNTVYRGDSDLSTFHFVDTYDTDILAYFNFDWDELFKALDIFLERYVALLKRIK